MILADAMSKNREKDLSGVNLLFLAPEYFGGDRMDWSADIWSLGVILYLLITGGVNSKRRGSFNEPRDFREIVWHSLDRDLVNFVKSMVHFDHN